MARPLEEAERRRSVRVSPEHTPWPRHGLLRPGQEVYLLNISRGGALLESHARMLPGARADLQLAGVHRRIVHGHVDRCRIAALDPVRYHGAIVFECALDWASTQKEPSR